jgi:threonine/homoserine/homoserine lactone efflux protein
VEADALHGLPAGIVLGLGVSFAPGANTALCLSLARGGITKAMPVVVSAALTDCVYALLCLAGVLSALSMDAMFIGWLSVGFLAVAAVALWPRTDDPPRKTTAVAMAAFNPATAAIWLGLTSTTLSVSKAAPGHLLLLPLGALIGSAGWFFALAYVSSRVTSRFERKAAHRMGQTCSIALVGLVLARTLTLLT